MFRFVPLFLVSLCAAQVVTYTAYSTESQAAADQEAVAGVAKQISSQVNSETSVMRSETQAGKVSDFRKEMQTRNMVRSDLFLKGVKIVQGKRDGERFVSTATVNLADLTAGARTHLASIQKSVSEREALARESIKKRRYADAAKHLDEARQAARPYDSYLDEVSVYVPIDVSMKLATDSVAINQELAEAIRSVKIELPGMEPRIRPDEPLVFSVSVRDAFGALENFPVFVEHGDRRLAEAHSDSLGKASFRIPAVALQSQPYYLEVYAGGPRILRQENSTKLRFPYTFDRKQCSLSIKCSDKAQVCSAIEQQFLEKLGISQSAKGKELQVKIETESRRTMKQLTSYAVTFTFTKQDFRCVLTENGVGKTEVDAVRNAAQKLKLSSCPDVGSLCSEK